MISTISLAAKLNASDRLEDAAFYYEAAFREGGASVMDCVDLLVIYFVCLDPGYAASHHLEADFVNRAFERVAELPLEIEVRFGVCYEAIFWQEYALFIVIGNPAYEEKWRQFIEVDNVLAPIIYFLEDVKAGKYTEQLGRLRHEISNQKTARERYINSILTNIV